MAQPKLTIETSDGLHDLLIKKEAAALRVSEVLRRENLPLNTRCGERGLCDGCLVELLGGDLIDFASGEAVGAEDEPRTLRACEYRLGESGDVTLRIPDRSMLAYEPQVVSNFKINVPRAHDPLWHTVAISREQGDDEPLSPQWLQAHLTQVTDHRHPVQVDAAIARRLAELGDAREFTVVLEYRGDHWLVSDVSAETIADPVGFAIDIGTTTVAVILLDLAQGEVLATTSAFNRQMHLGDDVLTRINLCRTDKSMIDRLHRAVVDETISPLMADALRQADVRGERVKCISMAGNTTMLHLLAGEDPSPMGAVPFTPVFTDHRVLFNTDIGLAISEALEQAAAEAGEMEATCGPGEGAATEAESSTRAATPVATIHLAPSPAAYVGADLTAGIFSSGLVYDDGPSMLVDVGTNGEIILKVGERIIGCATAAGPAFEGARLASGMRAGRGAVSRVDLTGDSLDPRVEVIGEDKRPIGVCGSAYIDFLAEGRRAGLLNTSGRFEIGVADEHLEAVKSYGWGFRVARGRGNQSVLITETDVASLLQAKAAIGAGILVLLQREGIEPADVKKLYLAGGFGLHLRREKAIACGLLPGFTEEQIEVVGNTSLAGAYLALLDSSVLDELTRIKNSMEILELNEDPNFEMTFIENLMLAEPAV